MARIFFVTGGAGGVGVGNLRHQEVRRKSNGGSRIVLNSSLMRSVTMSPPSDDLHNVLLANRPEVIPNKNNITVRGILEKSWLAHAVETGFAQAGLSRPAKAEPDGRVGEESKMRVQSI